MKPTTAEKETKKGVAAAAGRKWKLYSGLFVLLRKRLRFEADRWRAIL
jgi:hypothetical protein